MIEVPQVVTIAGIDSSGGAGVNADLKTFHNQGVYAASIIVGLTAQNTYGVQALKPTELSFLQEQFKSVADDLDIVAAKTGALFDADHVKTVAECLKKVDFGYLVVDPVMVAKGGAKLLTDDAIQLVKEELLPLADVFTPNLAEAEELIGHSLQNKEAIRQAAFKMQSWGVKNVLIKGGHREDEVANLVTDYVLYENGSEEWLSAERLDTVRTHGTGDTISAYITAGLAKGESLPVVIKNAKKFTFNAIKKSIAVGQIGRAHV